MRHFSKISLRLSWKRFLVPCASLPRLINNNQIHTKKILYKIFQKEDFFPSSFTFNSLGSKTHRVVFLAYQILFRSHLGQK